MFQHTCTVLNLLFHWSPLICTSIVFRDGGIVMWQSLLFSLLIKNNLSNSCGIAHMFAVFASGARTVKMFYFARLWYHLEKASRQFPVNKVIKFRPYWEAPYLWLVTYWISSENGGWNTKTPALIAGSPFPFPLLHAFLPPPPLFAPATQAIISLCIHPVCQNGVQWYKYIIYRFSQG